MTITIKGKVSIEQLYKIGQWVNENLTQLIFYTKPIYVLGAKITKAKRNITIQFEKSYIDNVTL